MVEQNKINKIGDVVGVPFVEAIVVYNAIVVRKLEISVVVSSVSSSVSPENDEEVGVTLPVLVVASNPTLKVGEQRSTIVSVEVNN